MGSYIKVKQAKRKAALCEFLVQTIRNTGKTLIGTGTVLCVVLSCMLDSEGAAFEGVLSGICVAVLTVAIGYLLTAVTRS